MRSSTRACHKNVDNYLCKGQVEWFMNVYNLTSPKLSWLRAWFHFLNAFIYYVFFFSNPMWIINENFYSLKWFLCFFHYSLHVLALLVYQKIFKHQPGFCESLYFRNIWPLKILIFEVFKLPEVPHGFHQILNPF